MALQVYILHACMYCFYICIFDFTCICCAAFQRDTVSGQPKVLHLGDLPCGFSEQTAKDILKGLKDVLYNRFPEHAPINYYIRLVPIADQALMEDVLKVCVSRMADADEFSSDAHDNIVVSACLLW